MFNSHLTPCVVLDVAFIFFTVFGCYEKTGSGAFDLQSLLELVILLDQLVKRLKSVVILKVRRDFSLLK